MKESLQERKSRIALEHAKELEHRNKCTALVRSIRADITKSGLQAVKYKSEYIINNPACELPKAGLDRGDVVGCYTRAFEQYEEYLKNK